MASVLSRRLGKRSLLGARVLGPPGAAPPAEPQAELLEGVAPQAFLASKDTSCQEQPKEVLKASCTSGLQQVAFQPGQKVGGSPRRHVSNLPRFGGGRPVVLETLCTQTFSLHPCGPWAADSLKRVNHHLQTQGFSTTVLSGGKAGKT